MPSRRMMLLLALAVATAPLAATLGTEAPAAAPRVIMFEGGPLAKRHFMTEKYELLALLGGLSVTSGDVSLLARSERPYINVYLYWGHQKWDAIARDPARLQVIDTTGRDVGRGRLYLADGAAPPLLVYHTASVGRVFDEDGLALLEKYDIPLR